MWTKQELKNLINSSEEELKRLENLEPGRDKVIHDQRGTTVIKAASASTIALNIRTLKNNIEFYKKELTPFD